MTKKSVGPKFTCVWVRAAFPVPIARRRAVKIEIEQMVKYDIWEQVNGFSPWALNLAQQYFRNSANQKGIGPNDDYT
uniref:Uncharacterized protein n=1 Tax=Romanomermis culicivorax TaxID=13658 RepID=A0A915I6Q0_ROMCU